MSPSLACEPTGASAQREIDFPIAAKSGRTGEGLSMRRFVIHSLAAVAIGALLAFPIAPAFAKTVAECNTEYAANKAAIRAAKQTKERKAPVGRIVLWLRRRREASRLANADVEALIRAARSPRPAGTGNSPFSARCISARARCMTRTLTSRSIGRGCPLPNSLGRRGRRVDASDIGSPGFSRREGLKVRCSVPASGERVSA